MNGRRAHFVCSVLVCLGISIGRVNKVIAWSPSRVFPLTIARAAVARAPGTGSGSMDAVDSLEAQDGLQGIPW